MKRMKQKISEAVDQFAENGQPHDDVKCHSLRALGFGGHDVASFGVQLAIAVVGCPTLDGAFMTCERGNHVPQAPFPSKFYDCSYPLNRDDRRAGSIDPMRIVTQ